MTGVVLVFGESLNDARAIAELIVACCPDLSGRVKPAPRPASLTRTAKPDKVAGWLADVADVARGFEARGKEVHCVFVHRDADRPDPEASLAKDTEAGLLSAGLRRAHAVVPVEAIEAWWLCFPRAVEGLVPGWKGALRASPGNVDRISQPKMELVRRTRRALVARPYAEADSHRIAQQVRLQGLARSPAGLSPSFARFVEAVDDSCPGRDRSS